MQVRRELCFGLLPSALQLRVHGCHGGIELTFSTYKKKCSERDTCPAFSVECENPTDGSINHVIFASETLSEEDVWEDLQPGEAIGVDHMMQLHRFEVDIPAGAFAQQSSPT